ncbi:MAG: secreted trypsin-like serine protease [Marmoricola sp.]|nr:secreted trypsin-like serine protease [Marmoricola sp.]
MSGTIPDSTRDLVDDLARDIAGDDDQAYVNTMLALLGVAGDISTAPKDRRTEAALRQLMRPHPAQEIAKRARARHRGLAASPPAAPQIEDTIYTDPVFVANAAKMVRHRRRVINGSPTPDFPDCVAVGSTRQWCCSGTLIGPNAVLTAAHCAKDECSERVMVGQNTEEASGRVVRVADVHVHPDYVPDGPCDLAVLVLSEEIEDVTPRAIASADAVEEATAVRVVGFGTIDVWGSFGYGAKRMVDVPLASSDPRYGADAKLEFVAGKPLLDKDSCSGDSGGPAYVDVGGAWELAGATSRATESRIRPCGDGGIYARVPAFMDWFSSLSGVSVGG